MSDYEISGQFDIDEDDLLEEQEEKNGGQPEDPERKERKAAFRRMYDEYLHPTGDRSAYRSQCLLDDLYLPLRDLHRGFAFAQAAKYRKAGFIWADGELACSIGCQKAYEQLLQDLKKGMELDNPVAYYLKVARNKTIDHYFRAEFGRMASPKKPPADGTREPAPEKATLPRRKTPWLVSWEGEQTDEDGKFREGLFGELYVDPDDAPAERAGMANRITVLYLQELMDYPDEPQKPLALMYGSIIFQLAREFGGHDKISKAARDSKKLASPDWAHRRMGKLSLRELGERSEFVVQSHIDAGLAWGRDFRRHMQEPAPDIAGKRWGNVVYTEAYQEDQTSNWIESIRKSTMLKCCRKMADQPELVDFAGKFGKNIRKAMDKIEKKEVSR